MVRLGVQLPNPIVPYDVVATARALEAVGVDTVFVSEHTHIPLATQSLVDDPDWLEGCKRIPDPFITLAMIAASTTTLRLGTGVALIPQHDPLVLAKTVATLDVLSGGRVLLGIGAGWNAPELLHHGVEVRQRFAVMREHVLALRALWTQEVAEFHGRYVDFGPSWQWPKPLQRGGPPIALGGEGPTVLQRVVDYADAWMPNDHDGVIARMAELRLLAEAAGRDPIPTIPYGVEHDVERIQRYAEAGCDLIDVEFRRARDGNQVSRVEGIAALIAQMA